MLKSVFNRNSVLTCLADCPFGQSRTPARTVFIRDVVHKLKNYEVHFISFTRIYNYYKKHQ